jgi:regulator of protease activity HflC (stomatin/prohibitin superfamily)
MTPSRILSLFGFFVVAIIALCIFFGSWYTVEQGERAVITTFGKVTSVEDPGLHFKAPFITTAHTLSTRSDAFALKTAAYSKDQQPADLELTITWHVQPGEVQSIYEQYRDLQSLASRLVQPRVLEVTKTIFGGFTAQSAIQDRGKLNADVQAGIQEAVRGPVTIDGVQITNIDFSDSYEDAVEARMKAQVEVEKSRQKVFNEQQLAQITVTQAQAAADSQLAQAKAKAESVRIAGEAEAAAIRAKGEALKDNPALLQYQAMGNGWDGKLPVTMVPGSALPFLGVK